MKDTQDNVMENEWIQWSKYVLKSLEKNETDHEKILDKLDEVRGDLEATRRSVAFSKGKMAGIGALGGMIPAGVFIVLKLAELF